METPHYGETLRTHMQQYHEYTLGVCATVIVKKLSDEQITIAQRGIIAHDYAAAY